MSKWQPISDLGTVGVITDLVPARLPPNALTGAVNVRAVGPDLANAGGYETLTPIEDGFEKTTLFFSKAFDERRLVLCGDLGIHVWDGTTFTALHAGESMDDGVGGRWSGGWLTGALTLANQLKVKTWRQGVDTSVQPMQYDPSDGATWESKNYQGSVFRPFRTYMFAGNVTWDGVEYPSRVQWCDAVEPGQIPNDWVPTDTNRAGDVDLADTPGSIVDMAPLRDSLLIYKEDTIHICQFVGGNSVFSFRRMDTNQGLAARDCIASYAGKHWCLGREDIFITDGNTTQSIVWGRIKEAWLEDMCPSRTDKNYVSLHTKYEEIVFHYVSESCEFDYPDKALVYSTRNESWFFRDYNTSIPHASVMLDIQHPDYSAMSYYAIDRLVDNLLSLESIPTRDSNAVEFSITRTGLFAEPAHDFIQVDRGKVQCSGQEFTLELGDQIATDAAVSWRPEFNINPATDYKTDARANGNQIAYRVSGSTTTGWKISSVNLLVQKSGERG